MSHSLRSRRGAPGPRDLRPSERSRRGLRSETDADSLSLSERSLDETGRAEELLDARTTAEAEPDRTVGRLKTQLELEKRAAPALEKKPIESVLNELRVLVEPRGIPVRGLSNLLKPSRDTSRHSRPPRLLLFAQGTKVTGDDGLGITHHAPPYSSPCVCYGFAST